MIIPERGTSPSLTKTQWVSTHLICLAFGLTTITLAIFYYCKAGIGIEMCIKKHDKHIMYKTLKHTCDCIILFQNESPRLGSTYIQHGFLTKSLYHTGLCTLNWYRSVISQHSIISVWVNLYDIDTNTWYRNFVSKIMYVVYHFGWFFSKVWKKICFQAFKLLIWTYIIDQNICIGISLRYQHHLERSISYWLFLKGTL